MATRTEKDRAKAQQEKFQAILSNLLKDEDNKYCEDCDAKGPRWASWNLGIFLCIRCAGIHRNLGVHISRVKSVNLDSWTAEQVAMMQEMGNSRARAVYEANVQDSFRRPQTDSALEAFIRAKYEQKKYIAKEWVPPKPVVPKEWLEDDKAEKKKIRNKPTSNISLSSVPPSSQSSSSSLASADARANAKPATTTAATAAAEPKPTQPPAPKPKSSSDDLLGLDFSFNDTSKAEVPQTGGSGGGQGGDLLADIFGGSQVSAPTPGGGGQQNLMATQQNGSAEPNLFESGSGEGQGEKKSAKDSIMALYGSGGGQQQMFGVPGYYVGQYTVASTDLTPNGDMMPHNSGITTSRLVSMASNNPALSASQLASGMMTSNLGMVNAFSGMDSRMTPSGAGLMTSNTGMLGPNPGIYSPTMSTSGSKMPANSPFKSQASNMVSGNAGIGRSSSLDVPGKPATLPVLPGTSQPPKLAQSGGAGQTLGTAQNTGLTAPRGGTSSSARSLGTAQNTGFMTSRAGMPSNTKSVSSHAAVMPTTKPQGSGVISPSMVNNPFLYTGAEIYQQYLPNMYYYPASGGMYMPQQQMYGTSGGGMQPMGQPQAGMMGMQQGMMGQPVQQGMMGMQQQPGMMFGNAGQMGQNQMGQNQIQMGQNQMGQNLMGGNMMGAGAQGGMMGRPAGQMYMQQQPQQQQMNPMQQQMQFQQMQQQMANMSMGGGSQMGGMQAPQQAAVGGGSWGGVGTGQTLSTNLWQ